MQENRPSNSVEFDSAAARSRRPHQHHQLPVFCSRPSLRKCPCDRRRSCHAVAAAVVAATTFVVGLISMEVGAVAVDSQHGSARGSVYLFCSRLARCLTGAVPPRRGTRCHHKIKLAANSQAAGPEATNFKSSGVVEPTLWEKVRLAVGRPPGVGTPGGGAPGHPPATLTSVSHIAKHLRA
jgi:hypothetical protein